MNAPITQKPIYTDLNKQTDKIVDQLEKGVYIVGSASAFSYMVNDILASTPLIPFKHPAPLDQRQREWLFETTGELATLYCQQPPFTDILGQVYMKYASRQAKSGLKQFFTPSNIAELMSTIVSDDTSRVSRVNDVIRYSEPCVGSGAMPLAFCRDLLAKSPNDLFRTEVYLCDLDILCCKMTAAQFIINYHVYQLAPVKGRIFHGNSLGEPSPYIEWVCDVEVNGSDTREN